MKEHTDDALSSIKQTSETVDCATNDEIVTERGKIEGIFGERESEDMVVEVVCADMVVDEDSKREIIMARDSVVEDVGVIKGDSDDVVESRVESLEKVEVVKEVIEENVVITVASGSVIRDSEVAAEPLNKEAGAGEGEVEVRDAVQEVADEKSQKETEVLSSSKILESTEGRVVIEEGLVGEDKGEDGVNNQTSLNEVVDEGVDQTKKDGVESTIEATDSERSGNVVELDKGVTGETVDRPTESVEEAVDVDCVMGEKTQKDEILDSSEVQDSVTNVDEVATKEGLAGKDETQDGETEDQSKVVNTGTSEGAENMDHDAEVDQKNEEGPQSTVEVITHDASESGKEPEVGDSKMDDEPEVIKEEIDMIDKEDETELGFTKETLEQPVNSVQEVADEDHGTSKIPRSSIMASLGLEEVDVDVVDEGLEGENEEQDLVSVEPSLVIPNDQSILAEVVDVGTGEVDQKAGLDLTSKTIKPDEVAVAQKEPNSDVQVSTDDGILVENENLSINVNAVTDGSKPDVVAYAEPDSATDKTIPSIASKVEETDTVAQTFKVEPAINEITTSNIRVSDCTVEVPTMGGQHDVLPANSEFSYEDAHMERGEDAGMDIDEVLGWKDDIPSVQEHEQKVDPTNLSNVEMQEAEALEHTLESEQWNKTPVSLQQSCYFHPPENEGEFSVSDLVWGKVRSHPWWPGQIFDPSDASEKAMKYHKKDCFLVAYFGDRTFAWNDSSVLKPFRENFSQAVDDMDSEASNNAVHCALQEVSRRVELGLTCSCIPHEIYENIKCQIVENSGIKPESSKRHGVDKSASVNSFEPDMLVDYVRLLARFPYGEGDKMELTIAKAQLSSYGRFKGHRQLAEFQLCGDLLEAEQVIKDEPYYEDSSKKRKALDSISDGSEKRPSLQTETVFKVGGSIQKVASQLTGPPDQVQSPGLTQPGNQADMLSQLHLAAQDPMKGYGFVNNIIPFFNSHRATTVLSKSRLNSSNDARKRKTSNENESENFEFDDVNDSYWTDRIIQNYPEENPFQETDQNGGGAHQIVAYEQEKQPVKPARRSNKKRFFSSNHEIEAKEQSELIERRRKNLATEVLMKFTEGIYFPSEIHLNKMFRRFGPLMESETEVDRQSGRARVVFKKCSDAEVAHSSAAKFSIFGSINVDYELNYTPLISYKPLPLPLAHDPAHAC